MPVTIAAAYAAAGRVGRAVAVIAWVVVIVLTVGLLSRYLERAFGGADLDGVLPEWLWLAVIALLAAIGLVRDLRPALARTRARLAAGDAGPARAGAALPALRVFVDELVPGRDAGRNEAVETERGRLAADLHAEVLPSLRRALAQAEAGGTVERLAIDLRSAVDEVESMLLARRSIVLEEMGLLAGLEWLAERVEDRSDVRVEIAVDGGVEADPAAAGVAAGSAAAPDRPPREAERAAFRVAQLALDNVVRRARRASPSPWPRV
jgi:signal transduction histidine kinase